MPATLRLRRAGHTVIVDELTARGVRLQLGHSVHEFEADLIRLRTTEGMKVARAMGRLKGKRPKLNARQEHHLIRLYDSGDYSLPSSPPCSASPAPLSTEHSSHTGRLTRRSEKRHRSSDTRGPPARAVERIRLR